MGTLTLVSCLAAAQPNIVFILVDDMGTGDLSCYGAPDVQTPRIDRLASEGVRFTQFYAMGAECTPSRTAFLTGRYPQRIGGLECAIGTGNVGRYDDAIRLAEQHQLGLPAERAVLAPALKDAGYSNVVFGKWHLGYDPHFHPLKQGFQEFIGFLGGYVDYFTHAEHSGLSVYQQGIAFLNRPGYMTELIAGDAVNFLERQHLKPFFLYLPFSVPHFPFQGPKDATGKTVSIDELTLGSREKYIEMLEDMDRQVGRILDVLEARGLADQTLVVFASDHGAMKPGRNLPLNGFKGSLLDGGIRIPCIVRWPGHLKPGSVSHQVGSLMDLTASFLKLAGATVPEGQESDGMDILEHVLQERPDVERTLFWRARRGDRTWRAVRQGGLKYVTKREGGVQEDWLFDLSNDHSETLDLKESRPDGLARLRGELLNWERKVRPER